MIIDGKRIAAEIRQAVKQAIERRRIEPGLAVLLIGADPASQLYVRLKERACAEVGIAFQQHRYGVDVAQETLLECVRTLNRNPRIDGILVQLPLPQHLDTERLIRAVEPTKDVDGFHPANTAALLRGTPFIIPGLVAGIMRLITSTGEKIGGRRALIVSNSETFARPLIKLLRDCDCRVDWRSGDSDPPRETLRTADILVVAVGKPAWVKAEMLKKDALVIDVGINRLPRSKRVVGDVDFKPAAARVAHITPVPGGVGPMTIAMLLQNTLTLALHHHQWPEGSCY